MKKVLFLLVALSLVGCATKVTVTGKSFAPTNADDIVVFASQKPNCDLKELALIVTNLKWNQEKAIKEAKDKAAEIGATHLHITDVKRNIYNDAAVQAVAYRCM